MVSTSTSRKRPSSVTMSPPGDDNMSVCDRLCPPPPPPERPGLMHRDSAAATGGGSSSRRRLRTEDGDAAAADPREHVSIPGVRNGSFVPLAPASAIRDDSGSSSSSSQCDSGASAPKFSQMKVASSLVSYSNLCWLLVLLLGCSEIRPTAGCSSRSTPKPRPPSQSAIRPNITFQTYACPPAYAAWYCLNGATCFTVKIADSILYNCECADGFMGQRCEFKDLDGSYLPTRERLMMLKNSRLGQVLIFVLCVIVTAAIASAIYTRHRTKGKQQQQQQTDGTEDDNVDDQAGRHSSRSDEERCARYNMSPVGGQSISYSISKHCDVIRGYNLGPDRFWSLRPPDSSNIPPHFNHRCHQTLTAVANSSSSSSRQRGHNNISM